AISIITPEMLKASQQDHAPHDRPLGHGQQEQQQQGRLSSAQSARIEMQSRLSSAQSARIETAETGFDTPQAATQPAGGAEC
ncbi:MAG TPA: hypothetical protein PL156_00665, partial [Rhodoglobus sp.]|nr:hypothetical protein [Rhodoglobus sp.]